MNEDLQRELLEIIRALKAGASPAWQVLVEQRAAYCMAAFWAGMVKVGIALAVLAAAVLTAWRPLVRLSDKAPLGDVVRVIVGGLLLLAGLIALASCLTSALERLPEAIAPLGRVLEVLR